VLYMVSDAIRLEGASAYSVRLRDGPVEIASTERCWGPRRHGANSVLAGAIVGRNRNGRTLRMNLAVPTENCVVVPTRDGNRRLLSNLNGRECRASRPDNCIADKPGSCETSSVNLPARHGLQIVDGLKH